MPSAEPGLTARHAVVLGLLQGPTELLPISSSAHTELVPWLMGWPYAELEGGPRKLFEVALHAGAGLALGIGLRGELAETTRRLGARAPAVLALATLPPAFAGLLLREVIERRFGGVSSIALGLAGGALAIAAADRCERARDAGTARATDGCALGGAQTLALIPGVSRNGATLAAARARGFSRGEAHALSWFVALPVIAGASGLEGARLLKGRELAQASHLLAGALSAFLSTLASVRLLGGARRGERALTGFVVYRLALAALVLMRAHRTEALR